MCEQGYVVPGSFVVRLRLPFQYVRRARRGGHAVVRTDAAAIWATGTFWWSVPRTVQVVLEGASGPA